MTPSYAVLTTTLVMTIGAMGCQSSVEVHAVQSPAAHFERYRTVSFETSSQAPDQYAQSSQSNDAQTEIHESAARILESRGYVLTGADRADLVVRIEEGRRERRVIVPALVPAPTNAGQTEYQAKIEDRQEDLAEGAFVINAFDGTSKALVWRGSGHADVTPGALDRARLRGAVESVLRTFPRAKP